jgi:ABC-type multidrug transport system permease subunit
MKDEHIKALIKEAIEEDRKERHAVYLWSFLAGLAGALIFFIPFPILLATHFNFIFSIGAGFVYAFDIWLMYLFTKR